MKPEYRDLVEQVRLEGLVMPSRFGDTYEMVGMSVGFASGEVPRRANWNLKLACIEAMQVIGGMFDADEIAKAAPNAPHFFTPDIAYGPRISDQLWRAVAKLDRNPTDRQVVIHIGREIDNLGTFPPCAQTLQFMIRNGKLFTSLYWRSWDMLMGLPYDVFVFQTLASAVALALGVEQGPMVCFAGSLHYYVKNQQFVPTTLESRTVKVELEMQGTSNTKWHTLVAWGQAMSEVSNWKLGEDGKPSRPYNLNITPWEENTDGMAPVGF